MRDVRVGIVALCVCKCQSTPRALCARPARTHKLKAKPNFPRDFLFLLVVLSFVAFSLYEFCRRCCVCERESVVSVEALSDTLHIVFETWFGFKWARTSISWLQLGWVREQLICRAKFINYYVFVCAQYSQWPQHPSNAKNKLKSKEKKQTKWKKPPTEKRKRRKIELECARIFLTLCTLGAAAAVVIVVVVRARFHIETDRFFRCQSNDGVLSRIQAFEQSTHLSYFFSSSSASSFSLKYKFNHKNQMRGNRA